MQTVTKITGKSKLKSYATKKFTKVRDIPPPHLSTATKRKLHVMQALDQIPTKVLQKKAAVLAGRQARKDVVIWTTSLDRAAYYIAEDRMSLEQVSEKTGVGVSKMRRMLALDGEFASRVAHYSEMWKKKVVSRGIADRNTRVNILDDIQDKLRQIIYERQQKYKNRKQPGVTTGLMVRTVKAVGHGHKTKIVRGWDTDKDLIQSIMQLQVQAAKDLGQWSEKVDNQNTVLVREYKGVNTADV